MSGGGRDRSLITAWVVGLAVCGIAAGLTLAIDRVGRPTTEIHVGDQGDSVPSLRPGATTAPTQVASVAGGDAAPADSTPTSPTTATSPGAGVAAPAAAAPAPSPVASAAASPSAEPASARAVPNEARSSRRATAAPVASAAIEQRVTDRGAAPRRQYGGVPATPRQRSAAEERAAERAVSARRESRLASRRVASTAAPQPAVDSVPWLGTRRAPSVALTQAVTDSVRVVLDRALADSAFPGAYAVVGTHAGVVAARGVGHLDWGAAAVPNARTIWDLASLTKVIGTTTAMMQLVERGAVDLDAPVQRYLPTWTGPNKDRVTVRHLLTHSSGLPAFRLFYKTATSPAQMLAMVYAEPLDTTPGARFVYSDLGAILLGEIVARVSGKSLDAYLASNVFTPLRMTSTQFRPDSSLLDRIAPTERDPWRGRLVRGEVHDENAYALGGIAGHAGLFSTGADLSRFAQMMLGGGALDGTRIVGTRTLASFTTLQDSALSNRALGWEKPTATNSAGHRLSRAAFGHTGFTGTSIWIDPANDVYVILLTNRVDPTRANNKIRGVRTALADAVMGAMGVPAPAAPTTPPAR